MEKVIVVGVIAKGLKYDTEDSLQELESLVNTAGGEVIERVIQKRDKFDPAYLIGEGKAREIAEILKKNGIRSVIFNNELSATQQRNLEELFDAKVIDRTRLILDIFAQRARSAEGKLQVELAQLKYMLPRLTKKGIWLDGQFGGIGTRGPGEKKLEYDRRKIHRRILKLEEEIRKIGLHRGGQIKRRRRMGIPVVSIIGYTNVGKSTLLNAFIENDVCYVDDKLFATLDPTTKRVKLKSGKVVLFTDTVGFIRNLPHQLIAAFKATLEEIKNSDLLLHLIDISDPNHIEKQKVVNEILKELNADEIPVLDVYNKCDLISQEEFNFYKGKGMLMISAKNMININAVLERVDDMLRGNFVVKRFLIPYAKFDILKEFYRLANKVDIEYTDNGVLVKIICDRWTLGKLKKIL